MSDDWLWGAILGNGVRPPSPVVKVGGSLLTSPGWAETLAKLLHELTDPLLIVGGGKLVDGLRAIDAASPRPPQLMHDLAIDAMTLTARLVAESLALPLVTSARADAPVVLDVAGWLKASPPQPELPPTWDITSDSLAAVVAGVNHRPLLLVKSAPPPPTATTIQSLADAGWVDAWFPTAAGSLGTISWAAPAAVQPCC